MTGGEPLILVVDDSAANLRLIGDLLKGYGYRLHVVSSGPAALRSAKSEPPDLILLDIDMPGMNGYEVCEELKSDTRSKDIPVIFLSALNETLDKVRAFRMGAVDFVTKPFQIDELLARIGTHLELNAHRRHLERLVQSKVKSIGDAQLATIFAMSRLAEARDEDTGKHIERTQTFCRILAEILRDRFDMADQIDVTFCETIFTASPLHDIGKVAIRDNILLKPARLTADEFEIMKTHTTHGANTLLAVLKKYPGNRFLQMGSEIARSHHERWDGMGYPDGLAGAAIPLAARIMAVADVYDALRSKRPYKEPFPHEQTLPFIREGRGTHFMPEVVDAFLLLESEFMRLRAQMEG